MTDDNNKKRNRLSLSCHYCKKRKVKCDRGRPCSSCRKHNVGHLCEYPDPIWSEPIQIQNGNNVNGHSSGTMTGGMSTFSVQRFHPSSPVAVNNMGSQTSFHVPSNAPPPAPTHAHAQPIVPSVSAPTGVHSELEELKNKIKMIEASLDKKQGSEQEPQPQPQPQPPIQSVNPYAPVHQPSNLKRAHPESNQQYNYQYQQPVQSQATPPIAGASPGASIYSKFPIPPTDTNNIPIKLPPIHWDPNKQKSPYFPPLEHKHDFDWNDFRYNSEKNPTFVGINPFASNEETMNFFVGYTPLHIRDTSRRMNYGPFAWLSIMKKDSGLLALWKFMMAKKADKQESLRQTVRSDKIPPGSDLPEYASRGNFKPMNTPSGKSAEPTGDKLDSETVWREKAIDRDGYNDLRLYGTSSKSSSSSHTSQVKPNEEEEKATEDEDAKKQVKDDTVDNERVLMNKHAISLGLTVFEGKIDQELQLIEKIQVILPKQKVVWTLINQFFVTMYPYMPFIDEGYFKQEMARILGPEGYADEQISSIKVEKRLDFAHIGILLLVLRFTYLSLFSNRNGVNENNLNSSDPSPKAQELKYLLSNPVNIDLISMAQLCLDQFELLRKTSLVVLQCAFFMRLYHMFAPEDGDGGDGGDSQIFNGMLVQIAYSMGINREPDNFEDICNDDKINNLGRKIWFFLMISDLIQAYQYGNPLGISEKNFDTSLPYYKKGNENIADIDMEKNVISTFAYFNKYYYKLVAILDVCLDIRKYTKLAHLTNLISDFEIHLSEHYGTLPKFLVPFQEDTFSYSFIKTMKCKNYMNMKGFLLSIFFHLYLFYESKKKVDFSFFYLKKIFTITCGEFIPSYFQLIGDNYANFGDAADLILNPSIETMIHKTSQMNFAVLVRVNATVYRMKQDKDHDVKMRNGFNYKSRFTKLCKISKILEFITKYCIAALSRLSQRYYYAWRVTKAHSYLLKLIVGEELYIHSQKDSITFLDLSYDQLHELVYILESSVKKFGKSKIYHGSTELIDEYNEEIELSHPSARFRDVPGKDHTTGVGNTNGRDSTSSNRSSYQQSSTPLSTHGVASVHSIPSSVDSVNNSELDDIQFLENAEIDKMWFQMASMKYNNNTNGNSNSNNNNNNTNINNNNNINGNGNANTGSLYNTVNGSQGIGSSSADDFGMGRRPSGAVPDDGNGTQSGSNAQGGEFINLNIPTPSLNPLSPESLSYNAAQNNGVNNNGIDPFVDVYDMDVFNHMPIDQILGLRDYPDDERW
ncbi:uncharacterized protein RJT21DRAFT_120932 [Scheffersomyces amazonensis]|uniref:uncharacterized protein n=1 Tax=Scheffersomyces amazonensis TaxID=1078765 RepID=UPI00315CEFCA